MIILRASLYPSLSDLNHWHAYYHDNWSGYQCCRLLWLLCILYKKYNYKTGWSSNIGHSNIIDALCIITHHASWLVALHTVYNYSTVDFSNTSASCYLFMRHVENPQGGKTLRWARRLTRIRGNRNRLELRYKSSATTIRSGGKKGVETKEKSQANR